MARRRTLDVKDRSCGGEAVAFRDLRAIGIRSSGFYRQTVDLKDGRSGREADAFRDLRATGIRASGFRSCASYLVEKLVRQ